VEKWVPAYGSERTAQCWTNVPTTGRIDDKIKMADILLKTNIPAFHHSIIPFPGKIRKPQKPLYSQKVVEIPRH
jgi:hypothetical protein